MNMTVAEARAIAKEAYIYGFPMVDNMRCNTPTSLTRRLRTTKHLTIPSSTSPACLHRTKKRGQAYAA